MKPDQIEKKNCRCCEANHIFTPETIGHPNQFIEVCNDCFYHIRIETGKPNQDQIELEKLAEIIDEYAGIVDDNSAYFVKPEVKDKYIKKILSWHKAQTLKVCEKIESALFTTSDTAVWTRQQIIDFVRRSALKGDIE